MFTSVTDSDSRRLQSRNCSGLIPLHHRWCIWALHTHLCSDFGLYDKDRYAAGVFGD